MATTPQPTVADLELAVEDLTDQLREASLSAQSVLAADDYGWSRVTGDQAEVIGRDAILQVARVARVMVAVDPLIKRGVGIRVAYLGVPAVAADSGEDTGGQDVNAVIQAFWDDPGNSDTFTSAQACEERERARATDGQHFHALITSPRTGRVQVRRIPLEQVRDIVTDPEDAASPWLYRREWTQRVVEQGYNGSTRSRTETRRAYYPDVNYRPTTRPRTIDGIPVEWDKPVVHTVVNRPDGSRWGVPDTMAAIPWARGYKDALQDWAKHNKALASIAFTASAATRKGAAAARQRIPAGDGEAGRTVITGTDSGLSAVNKAGAQMSASAAEPLAGLVASSLDVPKTMLLSDPGVTGARATAETLDRPLELDRLARRGLDAGLIRTVLHHVIREAVRAPAGPLRGTVRRDPDTGREIVALAGEQDSGITIDWPSLDKVDIASLMQALSTADGMDLVPPETIARLVLVALGVDDVDEVLAELRGPDGTYERPAHAADARDASAALDIADGQGRASAEAR